MKEKRRSCGDFHDSGLWCKLPAGHEGEHRHDCETWEQEFMCEPGKRTAPLVENNTTQAAEDWGMLTSFSNPDMDADALAAYISKPPPAGWESIPEPETRTTPVEIPFRFLRFSTKHAAQSTDRVTDNIEQFKRRWKRVRMATNFTEAGA